MAVTGQDEDEQARLASRIAMLASDPEEAANAGRAAGAMARKLGLSGGDLKEIFLAGLRLQAAGRRAGHDLLRENEALREHLEVAEIAAQHALRERDRLRKDMLELRAALQSRRRNDVLAMVVGVVLVGVATVGGAWFLTNPASAPAAPVVQRAEVPGERLATVRSPGATVRVQPDPDAGVLAQLPPGSQLSVRRLVWASLLQWVEVDLDGRQGYIVTTDVDL